MDSRQVCMHHKKARCTSQVLALHCRIVTVEYRVPGGEKPQDSDYYWSMWHDRQHNTFIDSFTDEPLSKALHTKSDGPRVCPDSHHASSRFMSDIRLDIQILHYCQWDTFINSFENSPIEAPCQD